MHVLGFLCCLFVLGGGVVVSGGVLQNLLLITFLNKSEKR